MIKNLNIYFFIITFCISIIFTNNQYAAEMIIYGDDISYDNQKNMIIKGKGKILYDGQILTSNLIIYSQKKDTLTLPIEFSLKDKRNNFYYGSSGFFSSKLDAGEINDVKIELNDGSRIVGKKIKRNKNIDIISKAVYSPCKSKIKIGNFMCPIWQVEGEKILHNFDNLFLYQKHSKMRVLNTPVFYAPYLVTPSPLRKERKSGFLSPSINLNFFDTKISQSISFPYYFNIDTDKELTFTPTINYGGGVDSSQRFNFEYNQIISGGNFKTDILFDSNFENDNSDKWLSEGSIISSYNQNINANYNLKFSSTLQTSKNYIQQTNPNDQLSYSSSLKSVLELNGYSIRNFDDKFKLNITNYQSNQNNEDNKTLPTILPFLNYQSGKTKINNFLLNHDIELYNIFREKSDTILSKEQKKVSSEVTLSRSFINYGTKFNLGAKLYNQYFITTNKKINNDFINTNYFRSFPIFKITSETPFKLKKNYKNFVYTPKVSIFLSPGLSNTNKISNETSSINTYSIDTNDNYNRYTGSDKLDNSKRINISFNVNNDLFDATVAQTYEITNNSNYHFSQGNEKNLSDLLGNFKFKNDTYDINYDLRFDPHENFMKSQNVKFNYQNNIGKINLSYLDQKSKTSDVIITDRETLNYRIDSKEISKYSKISYFGLYDVNKSINTESGISYSYFDECFGVNIDFKRNSYTEDDLKPQDILTIMFSFKNLGSYKSTNLAVSENDKQDIEWESLSVNNELFD